MPPCLIGMEACVGAHHLSRKLGTLGHDAPLMPAKYVRPYSKGQKNDFRDAEAIAEAVQRPTMKFMATKTAEQLNLQALHRVRYDKLAANGGWTAFHNRNLCWLRCKVLRPARTCDDDWTLSLDQKSLKRAVSSRGRHSIPRETTNTC
jgi:hypothetical protein